MADAATQPWVGDLIGPSRPASPRSTRVGSARRLRPGPGTYRSFFCSQDDADRGVGQGNLIPINHCSVAEGEVTQSSQHVRG